MARHTNTTLITLRTIPGYPRVEIVNQAVDKHKTWQRFLKHQSVILDPEWYIVYNKSRKTHAYLDSPIGKMVEKFQRQKSLTVTLVKTKKPMLDRGGSPSRALQTQTDRGRPRQSARQQADVQNRPAAPATAGSRYSYPEDSMRIPKADNVSQRRSFDDLPPLLQREQILQGQRPPPQVMNFDSDDDNMSQISQGDEDEDQNGDGLILKRQMIQAVQGLPGSVFIKMKEELQQLKASGGQRDYKWIHYAPRTSAWMFSAFKL